MEEDKATDPANVSSLSAEAKMSYPGDVSNLVEEFWTGHRSRRILWVKDLSGAIVKRG